MLYKFLSNYGLAVSVGTAALMILIAGIIYTSNPEAYILELVGEDDIPVGEVGGLFIMGYILIGLASISALLVFPVKALIENPKSGLRVLIGIGVVGLVYLIFSLNADTEISETLSHLDTQPTIGQMEFTAGILGTALVLLILGVISLIGSEIYKLVK